jgi:hypothetical protein
MSLMRDRHRLISQHCAFHGAQLDKLYVATEQLFDRADKAPWPARPRGPIALLSGSAY